MTGGRAVPTESTGLAAGDQTDPGLSSVVIGGYGPTMTAPEGNPDGASIALESTFQPVLKDAREH